MNSREPVFNIPAVIVALLLALAAIHGARELAADGTDFAVLSWLAFVPARLAGLFDARGVHEALAQLGQEGARGRQEMMQALEMMGRGGARPWTLLSYALLHADWTHLGLNGLWLAAFGTPVARRFGPARFCLLLAATAAAGALAYFAAHPYGLAPMIGASAAVSGAMGAALRFAFQPQARFQRAVPLLRVFAERRTLSFVAVWIAINIATGLLPGQFGIGGAIAWEAHLGGLAAGLALFGLLDPPARLASKAG